MTCFPSFDPISKCWPVFKILTRFQSFDTISKCWPVFKMLTRFQNLDPVSKFGPVFKIWTHFPIFEQFSEFWPIFKLWQPINQSMFIHINNPQDFQISEGHRRMGACTPSTWNVFSTYRCLISTNMRCFPHECAFLLPEDLYLFRYS